MLHFSCGEFQFTEERSPVVQFYIELGGGGKNFVLVSRLQMSTKHAKSSCIDIPLC